MYAASGLYPLQQSLVKLKAMSVWLSKMFVFLYRYSFIFKLSKTKYLCWFSVGWGCCHVCKVQGQSSSSEQAQIQRNNAFYQQLYQIDSRPNCFPPPKATVDSHNLVPFRHDCSVSPHRNTARIWIHVSDSWSLVFAVPSFRLSASDNLFSRESYW